MHRLTKTFVVCATLLSTSACGLSFAIQNLNRSSDFPSPGNTSCTLKYRELGNTLGSARFVDLRVEIVSSNGMLRTVTPLSLAPDQASNLASDGKIPYVLDGREFFLGTREGIDAWGQYVCAREAPPPPPPPPPPPSPPPGVLGGPGPFATLFGVFTAGVLFGDSTTTTGTGAQP